MKYAIPAMQRNGGSAAAGGGGAIVNIASGCSSFIAQPAFVPYSTTKGTCNPLLQLQQEHRVMLGVQLLY